MRTIPKRHPYPLAAAARVSMEATFALGEHAPDAGQWAAIDDYLHCAERAANDDLAKAVYVSAIPAGTGKSVAVAAFASAVVASESHRHVGVLIAVNRLSEARDMAEALSGVHPSLWLEVGKAARGELQPLGGAPDADLAQIILTTHESLRGAVRHQGDFNKVGRYYFNGRRRQVVLWDEAVAFNRPVVLDGDSVGALARGMRAQSEEAARAIKQFAIDLDVAPVGACLVPDFTKLGVDWDRLESDARTDEEASQARALSIIAGESGHVMRTNAKATSLVTYVPELPASLLPILVTDASAAKGVHHGAYEQMATTLPVIQLKEASKAYRNLTLRLVPVAASRSAYRAKGGKALIELLVTYVKACAPEPVVVVSYKNCNMMIPSIRERTIREAVDARLSDSDRARTSHLTWGSHTATNEYKAIKHVIFAGLNFLPPSAAYAASGAVLAKRMNTNDPSDHPTPDQVKQMERGMLRDSTLQAVLRGAARMGIKGDCGVMEAVIPQAATTGLTEEDYRGMFPECNIVVDRVLAGLKTLKGNLGKLAAIVTRRQAAGEKLLSDQSLYGELGMTKNNWVPLKAKPEWASWVVANGWIRGKLPGGLVGLRR